MARHIIVVKHFLKFYKIFPFLHWFLASAGKLFYVLSHTSTNSYGYLHLLNLGHHQLRSFAYSWVENVFYSIFSEIMFQFVDFNICNFGHRDNSSIAPEVLSPLGNEPCMPIWTISQGRGIWLGINGSELFEGWDSPRHGKQFLTSVSMSLSMFGHQTLLLRSILVFVIPWWLVFVIPSWSSLSICFPTDVEQQFWNTLK